MNNKKGFPPSWELRMPKMGESITEGTIINWLVNEGDAFEEGDIILEVATDKVDNEVPAPISGILTKTLFQAKDVVPVGEVIAILEESHSNTNSNLKPNLNKNVILSNSEESEKKPHSKSKSTVTSSAVEMRDL